MIARSAYGGSRGGKTMNLIVLGATLIIVACVLRFGLQRVPPMHYAMINVFGKRWRVAREGLIFLIPGMESMDLFPISLQREDVVVLVKSRDLLGVQMRGSVEYALDPGLLVKYQETAKERAAALVNSIKTELGIIAGTKNGRDFVLQRESIVFLINCILRLRDLPHDKPLIVTGKKIDKEPVSPAKRLDFYKKNREQIKRLLDEETKKPDERSAIEEMYGIDIRLFDLDLDYSRETSAAFEKEKQDEAKARAAKNKLELIAQFIEKGATFQEAVNAAEQSLGQASRVIHSIEGKPISISLGGGHGNGQ